ncbi:MAG: hypothetical protein ACE5KG_02500 [Nitrososphaerales archaeon]
MVQVPASRKKRSSTITIWYAFIAFLAIGFALGLLFEQVAVGVIIGWGVGILSVLILKLRYPEFAKTK